jgi:hypothetical protein
VVKLDRELWEPHLTLFARKILLSLHYQCFGKPLSKGGRLCYSFHTNADFMANQEPAELIKLASNVVLPARQRTTLHDQFAVRWNVVPEKDTALFVAKFHKMIVLSGITTEHPSEFKGDDVWFPPF